MRDLYPNKEERTRELLLKIKNGQPHFFEEIVQIYQDGLAALARRFFSNQQDLEEALQEIFLRLYQNLDKFRGEAKFFTWAYRIAVNCCINMHNKMKKDKGVKSLDQKLAESEFQLQIPDTTNNPEKKAIENESVTLILQEMDKLPTKYSRVLLLREWQEFSYDEIAQVENCSLASVKTRIRRGRLLLIERLKPKIKEWRRENK
ncbi:RNA polymerase sigma factor [Candidatus Riflebacteria bacterium]